LWLHRQRRAFFYAGAAALGLAVVAATSTVYRAWVMDSAAAAIITLPGGTAARFQPSTAGTEHFNLPEGTRVEVIERRDTWAQVARCDGRRGWVEQAAFTILRP
jgi:hypothetical protein